MPPKKNTISNNMTSQDGPNHGDSKSRQNVSYREEERANEGAFTLTDLVVVIHSMGETQREMAKMIKELKSSVAKPSKENEKLPQEESAAAENGRSQKDWKYLPQPPYPSSLLQQPYPKGYEAPSFVLFDGRKGSPKEHVNRFIDALGPHAGDYNFRLREFSKSLTDRAYTWYMTLTPGSVFSWEDLASRFYKKYFQHEDRVTTTQLNNTHQKHGEEPVEFVRREYWHQSIFSAAGSSEEDEHVRQANGIEDLEEREEGDAPSVSYR
ncbi:unnamed protein product [Prunus armeniaca]